MAGNVPDYSPKRILEPIDRISEALFGLIMVLAFTGSLSVAQAGRQDIRAMVIGALGCNLAWGLIDAIMYLMGCLADRAKAAAPPGLSRDDWRGAAAVFLIVFLSTLPVVLPFVFLADAMRAMRLSNAVAVAMLFITGYAFGRQIRHRPVWIGLSMVILGSVLVAITIALGG
jgi:hypothetical protein